MARVRPAAFSAAALGEPEGRELESFAPLVEGVTDYQIVRLDPEGRICGWSAGAEAMLGLPAAEVMGRHVSLLHQGGARAMERIDARLAEVRGRGRAEFEGWMRKGDGRRCWTSAVVLALTDPEGRSRGFLVMARDQSERKRREDVLAAALEVSQAILAGQSTESLLGLISRRARLLLEADGAGVYVPEAGGATLVLRGVDGRWAALSEGMRFPLEGSLGGLVFRSGRALNVSDLWRSRRSFKAHRLVADVGPTLFAPLLAEGRCFGALIVSNRRGGHPFEAADLRLLRLFADQAAIAVHQAGVPWEQERLAVVEERSRLARDLHRGAVQSLYAATLDLGLAAQAHPPGPRSARLGELAGRIDSVIQDLRNHVFELRPSALAGRRLGVALEELVRDFESRTGVTTALEVSRELADRLEAAGSELVPVVKEALSNVARHARARTCRVSLAPRAGRARLAVEDDGAGFDTAVTSAGGEGLRNFQERAARLGGRLWVESVPGAGTAVRLELPL